MGHRSRSWCAGFPTSRRTMSRKRRKSIYQPPNVLSSRFSRLQIDIKSASNAGFQPPLLRLVIFGQLSLDRGISVGGPDRRALWNLLQIADAKIHRAED